MAVRIKVEFLEAAPELVWRAESGTNNKMLSSSRSVYKDN